MEEGTAEFKKSNKEHDNEKKEEQEKYEKQIGYLTYLGQDTNEALGKKNWYDVMPDRSSKCEGEVGLKAKLLHDPLTIIKKYTDEMKPKQEPLAQKLNKHVFPITSYGSTKERTPRHSERCRKHKHRSSSSDSSHKSKKKKHKKHKSSSKKRRKSSSDDFSEQSEDENVKQEKKRKLEMLRIERLAREREERKRTEMLFAGINGTNTKTATETIKKPIVKQKYNSQFNPELAKQNYD